MKADILNKLEKDVRLKKKYLPQSFWIKNPAIYPPSIFIFFSLFGLLYLLGYDMLISYYAIPFILLFLLSTIWLKSAKRYVLKKLFEQEELFVICLGRIIKEQNNKLFVLLTKGEKRHNKHFLQNVEKEIEKTNLDEVLRSNKVLTIDNISSLEDQQVYIKCFKKSEVLKSGNSCSHGEFMPMFYVGGENFVLIKRKDVHFS